VVSSTFIDANDLAPPSISTDTPHQYATQDNEQGGLAGGQVPRPDIMDNKKASGLQMFVGVEGDPW
jgi:hypothetical protein